MRDPQSLLDAAIDCKPLSSKIFTMHSEGVYLINDWAQIEALEYWPWHKIFDLPGIKAKLREARNEAKKDRARKKKYPDLPADPETAANSSTGKKDKWPDWKDVQVNKEGDWQASSKPWDVNAPENKAPYIFEPDRSKFGEMEPMD